VGGTRGAGVALGFNVAVGVAVGLAVGVAVVVAVGVGVGVTLDWAQYLPPVFKTLMRSSPPQTIISLKVQTAVCKSRAEGALVGLVAVQLFVPGSYLPPVLKTEPSNPPQMIISLKAHTAV
jgi:hypothetical protein